MKASTAEEYAKRYPWLGKYFLTLQSNPSKNDPDWFKEDFCPKVQWIAARPFDKQLLDRNPARSYSFSLPSSQKDADKILICPTSTVVFELKKETGATLSGYGATERMGMPHTTGDLVFSTVVTFCYSFPRHESEFQLEYVPSTADCIRWHIKATYERFGKASDAILPKGLIIMEEVAGRGCGFGTIAYTFKVIEFPIEITKEFLLRP